jgi:membrane associated rhomboid family serine protease
MYQQESFRSAFKRGFRRMPPVIRTIIAISVIVFIIQAVIGGIQAGGRPIGQYIVDYFGFNPSIRTALTQPWRFVTYLFLHGGGFHLLFNMLWLWWMGRSVEESIGPRSFVVLFFGSGIGGAFFHIAFASLYGTSMVIGASGAVFGVMVAFAYLYPRTPIMLLFLPPIEARFVVAGLIAFDVLFIGSGDNVARLVHLGGAGVGYLLIKAHYEGKDLSAVVRPIERLWQQSPKSKASKKTKNSKMYSVSDVEIVEETNQDELDQILEKISKSGYDGLTKEEKRKLFELSKKN